MTTKASDFSLETKEFCEQRFSQDTSCQEPSEFKTLLEDLDDDVALNLSCKEPSVTLPLTPFDLIKPSEAVKIDQQVHIIAPSEVVAIILEDLGAYIGLLTHEIMHNGIQTTQVVISKESSLLDGVEIALSTYDTAPGFLQIEISSCHKLEALLHSHERSFVACILQNVTMLKVDRLELNGKSLNLKQDRIEGSLQKKVTKAR